MRECVRKLKFLFDFELNISQICKELYHTVYADNDSECIIHQKHSNDSNHGNIFLYVKAIVGHYFINRNHIS